MALVNCNECNTIISSEAKNCPHCGIDRRNWFIRHPFITLIIVVNIVILILNSDFRKSFKDGFDKEYYKNTDKTEKNINQSESQIPIYADINDQNKFHNILKQYSNEYSDKKNEIQKSDVFNNRKYYYTEFVKQYNWNVKSWEGVIKNISTDKGGGKLYFTIVSIFNNFSIKFTTGNCLWGCGIERGTAVYDKVRNLEEEQKVLFNGKFIEIDGIPDEMSITEWGSMEYPEFRFEFTDIQNANSNTEKQKNVPEIIQKMKLQQKVIDSLFENDNMVSTYVKLINSEKLIQIFNNKYPENDSLDVIYYILRDKNGNIVRITENPFSITGDWYITYVHYFDKNGKVFIFRKNSAFYNSICTEGRAMEFKTQFFNNKFESIYQEYELMDELKQPLKKDKCVFPYDFDYTLISNLDEYLKEKKLNFLN